MQTIWLLMARYEGLPIIPVDVVVRDFFAPLTRDKFLRQIADGDIVLPLVRMTGSQKSAKGVGLQDLASYLDERLATARAECDSLNR